MTREYPIRNVLAAIVASIVLVALIISIAIRSVNAEMRAQEARITAPVPVLVTETRIAAADEEAAAIIASITAARDQERARRSGQ